MSVTPSKVLLVAVNVPLAPLMQGDACTHPPTQPTVAEAQIFIRV